MTTRTLQVGIAVAVAIAVVVIFFIFNPFMGQQADTQLTSLPDATNLVVQDQTVGTGAIAEPGAMLTVNYTGKLENGTVFDTSAGNAPYKFVLGAGDVIAGWDQGLVGMREGGKRILIVPPSLGYGATGNGPVPPNATLTFEVELLKVTPSSEVAPFPEGLEAH
jgi:FKBP-type peptidyl-prolyl cis-trans isomerase FkpA